MLEPALQTIVDRLCEDGCTAVNDYIKQIERGEYPALMRDLNPQQGQQVLAELLSIMAVYTRRSK
ncbi:MAG: hypothetical protein GC149_09535 [Gammaproteobacteria bacterium]|nr:hypothetical protein [Gammaproteobacteria bacterium]